MKRDRLPSTVLEMVAVALLASRAAAKSRHMATRVLEFMVLEPVHIVERTAQLMPLHMHEQLLLIGYIWLV